MIPNEFYLINYLGGTSGMFIQQLVLRILHNRIDPIKGINGNAHVSNLAYFENSVISPKWKKEVALQNNWVHPIYEFITPNRPNDPIVANDHCPPNWEELFKKFPNAKNIIIQANRSNIERILGNMFFKVNILDKDVWERFKTNLPGEYNNSNDLPPDIIETYIKNAASKYGTEREYIFYPYYENDPVPHRFADRILVLTYDQILKAPHLVLEKLSKFLNKELPIGIDKLYKEYLQQQQELVDTKMPWLNK